MGLTLKDAPPYVPDYRKRWTTPKVEDVTEWEKAEDERRAAEKEERRKLEEVQQKWWDNLREVHNISYEGHGDTELGYECFNDFTDSPELRTKMREQMNLEFFCMPDLDGPDLTGAYWTLRRGKQKTRKIK